MSGIDPYGGTEDLSRSYGYSSRAEAISASSSAGFEPASIVLKNTEYRIVGNTKLTLEQLRELVKETSDLPPGRTLKLYTLASGEVISVTDRD